MSLVSKARFLKLGCSTGEQQAIGYRRVQEIANHYGFQSRNQSARGYLTQSVPGIP